jgi:WD40 repeat protein
MILTQDPPAPRTHNSTIPRDLEAIALKALAKVPQNRYASCQQLADDLRRWLNHEPIQARSVFLPERFVRWCRRQPMVAGLTTAVFAAIVSGLGISLWQRQFAVAAAGREKTANAALLKQQDELIKARDEAQAQRNEVVKQRGLVARQLYVLAMSEATQALDERNFSRVRSLLQSVQPSQLGVEARGWEWRYLNSVNFSPQAKFGVSERGSIQCSPDGTKLATAPGRSIGAQSDQRVVGITDLASGRSLGKVPISKDGVRFPRQTPSMAWASDNRTLAVKSDYHSVTLWNAATGSVDAELSYISPSTITCLAWSPDGKTLAIGADSQRTSRVSTDENQLQGAVTLWNRDTGQTHLLTFAKEVLAVAWKPDSQQLAVGFNFGQVEMPIRIVDVKSGRMVRELGSGPRTLGLSWHSSGKYLAQASGLVVTVWNMEDENAAISLPQAGNQLSWHPTEMLLAIANEQAENYQKDLNWDVVRVWKVEDNIVSWSSWIPSVSSVAWAGQSSTLLCLSADEATQGGAIFGIDVKKHHFVQHVVLGASRPINATNRQTRRFGRQAALCWSSDGKSLNSLDEGVLCVVQFPSLATAKYQFPSPAIGFLGSTASQSIGIILDDSTLLNWDTQSNAAAAQIQVKSSPWSVVGCKIPGGMVFGTFANDLKIWNCDDPMPSLQSKKLPGINRFSAVLLNAQSNTIAVGDDSGVVQLFSWPSLDPIHALNGHQARVNAFAFGGAEQLASASQDGMIRIWNARTGECLREWRGHESAAHALSWHPFEERLASVGEDGTARIWDSSTGDEVSRLITTNRFIYNAVWSPDGNAIAARGPSVHVFTAPPKGN